MDQGSVDDAYQRVQALLASTAFTDAQKAAIAIVDVQRRTAEDPTSPVIAYAVELRGEYNSDFDMRLGDVQRSAMNILTVVMQSSSFEQLAKLQGIRGVRVRPYLAQFPHLDSTLIARHGPVVRSARGR